jgi:S1-C subfamily serine protease
MKLPFNRYACRRSDATPAVQRRPKRFAAARDGVCSVAATWRRSAHGGFPMSSPIEWELPPQARPKPEDYAFDLDAALAAVMALKASVPADAFTAATLGTEREGNAVLIRADGLVLTIGYLVTEAESVWLTASNGRALPGHVLAYDQITGFGLVQALGRLDLAPLALGESGKAQIGDRVIVAGAGGRRRSIAARITGKQEFAGYWEYVLDEAIFTAPAHPNWGGAALIGSDGRLLGIGSLHLEQAREKGPPERLNMIVPIDLLKPILDDLLTHGRRSVAPRPWLGVFATEIEGRIVIADLSERGPAKRAKLHAGDIVLAVGGKQVGDLASFFRGIWRLGDAGVDVPLLIYRDGRMLEMTVRSADRSSFLKTPRLH